MSKSFQKHDQTPKPLFSKVDQLDQDNLQTEELGMTPKLRSLDVMSEKEQDKYTKE
jgi:hypothetical protein